VATANWKTTVPGARPLPRAARRIPASMWARTVICTSKHNSRLPGSTLRHD
jgi:hypothetical protein